LPMARSSASTRDCRRSRRSHRGLISKSLPQQNSPGKAFSSIKSVRHGEAEGLSLRDACARGPYR
jgi:hypothetical protein